MHVYNRTAILQTACHMFCCFTNHTKKYTMKEKNLNFDHCFSSSSFFHMESILSVTQEVHAFSWLSHGTRNKYVVKQLIRDKKSWKVTFQTKSKHIIWLVLDWSTHTSPKVITHNEKMKARFWAALLGITGVCPILLYKYIQILHAASKHP